MRYVIKELTLGGILDQAIALLKARFKTFLAIMSFIYIPVAFLYTLASVALTPKVVEGMDPRQVSQQMVPSFILVFAYAILMVAVVGPLTNAALILASSDEYLGRTPNAKASMRASLRLWASLLWAGLLKGVFITFGLALCLIPGVYLFFRYYFVDYVVVLEGKRGLAALKRSKELMKQKGNLDKAFLLGLLVGVIGFLVGVISNYVPSVLLQALIGSIIGAVIFLFGMLATVVFYFSSRCKLENYDLHLLAESVGRPDNEAANHEGELA